MIERIIGRTGKGGAAGWLVGLFALFFGLSAGAMADEAAQAQVRVGVILSNPPYITEHPSAGIDNDVVREALRNIGYETEFSHAPLSRLDTLFDDHKVEAITTFNPRREGCVMSASFSYWHDGVIVRRELGARVHAVQDLKGLNVGTFPRAELALGDRLAPYLPTFAKRMAVFRTDLVAPMLERGRIDAYIGDIWAVDAAFDRQAGPDAGPRPYVVAEHFTPTPRWLCFHDAALAARFNTGLEMLKASGRYQAIIQHYHPGP